MGLHPRIYSVVCILKDIGVIDLIVHHSRIHDCPQQSVMTGEVRVPMLFRNNSDQKFFTLLRGAAANMCEAATLFGVMADEPHNGVDIAARLKELERTGDDYTQQLVSLLNATFITPLEREDILALAQELDDMVDGIEASASRMAIYGVTEGDIHIRSFAGILRQQTAEIAAAVETLGGKQLTAIREHNARIKVLEKGGDEELRRCLIELFSGMHDPIHLIKMKEIYETLETTTDRAEDIADTLESVVMKNA